MSNPAMVIAAGGVVWRESHGSRQVLLIHRPRYDDWSLPKGKLTPQEHVLVAARREIEEETGQHVTLGPSLGIQRYDVRKNGGIAPKLVHYWAASLAGPEQEFEPNDEVDKLEWLPVAKAQERLSYPRDVDILNCLDAVLPVESTVVILRHAEAVKRKDWSGKDVLRPLSDEGLASSERLSEVMGALGVNRLHSSNAERCARTVTPYAASIGRRIHLHPEISEQGYEKDPSALETVVAKAWRPGKVTLICSHRPVLPGLAKALGLPVGKFATSAFLVAHRLADGRVIRERFGAP
jgi:8-oxo-(d)GTP phosphatase